jgi:Na+-transporting methylmalonyl-CoA/oxaloacetate decarboxylase gamma subunit
MIVGIALVALGVMLLVLPGPGVVLIVLGFLICAPGWRGRIVRSMVARPRALREINAFRRLHGRPDVRLP